MSKKLTFSVILFIIANLIFAQTTNRGLVLETITDPETTLGKPEIKFQMGHTVPVTSVSFSPDGKYIVSGSCDRTVKLWSIESGKEVRSFTGHTDYVTSVSFSPDGKYLASGSNDDTIKLWEVESGKEVRSFKGHVGNVEFVSFSPEGKYLASADYSGIRLWEVESGKEVKFYDSISGINSVSFSPFWKYIAIESYDGTIRLWEVESGKEIKTFTVCDKVDSIRLSPDGKYLACISEYKTIKLWEVESGKEVMTVVNPSIVEAVSFSPNGKYIASGGWDTTTKLWDIESGKEIKTFYHSTYVNSVSFSPDGRYIASGSYNGTIKLWDIESGKEIKTFSGHSTYVNSVSLSPDGKYLVGISNANTIKLWEVESGKEIKTFFGYTDNINSASFSPDGKYIASGDRDTTIKLWDIESGKEIKTFSGHTYSVEAVSFSSNGKYIASGSSDDTVKLWEVESGKEVKTFTDTRDTTVEAVSFSPNGKYIASGDWDKTIKLWDIESGKEIKTFSGHTSIVNSVSFSPNGKYIASGSSDDTVKLWEVESGKEVKTFTGHTAPVTSVSFSPNGKYIASGDWDNTIKLWEVESGKEKRTFLGHTNEVNSINFSPDDKYLVSGSDDGTVKVWNVETGELIYTIINGKDGEWLTYTPEGFFTGSEWATKNLVHIVDGLEVIGIDQVYDKLYRPDLVAAKMRGEDISVYAKEVNLASLVRSGSVPVVTLENLPENPTSRDITFDVCVKNTGGGIGKVNLVLNGKTIQLSEGVSSSTGQTVNFRHTITLQNGENTIEAFAYNGSGMVESRRPSSIISWEGKTTKPNLYVLTLAINKYRDKSLWLNYCVPDANAIAESFKSQESGLYENVYVSSLQDGEVTKEGISEEFERLSNLVTADDVFVFYISGHGTTYDDGDYYYLPVNIRYTSREEIPIQGVSKNDLIENLSLIKAGKTLLMLDTCNSGAFFANSGQRGLSEKTAIDRLTRATGHATLAASSDSQSAMEGYEGHGVFTYVLLEGLKGEADSNDDGFVTLLELASYVENEVPERSYEKWGYEQVPQKDLRRQDFPIAGRP